MTLFRPKMPSLIRALMSRPGRPCCRAARPALGELQALEEIEPTRHRVTDAARRQVRALKASRCSAELASLQRELMELDRQLIRELADSIARLP
jgi:hypothetical protein